MTDSRPPWLSSRTDVTNVEDTLHKDFLDRLDNNNKRWTAFTLVSLRAILGTQISSQLTHSQIFDVIGNSISETGAGFWRNNNLGGVKITKSYVDAYKKATGEYASGINPGIYGPLFQKVKDRLTTEGKDTSDPTIVLTAVFEADERLQALKDAPKYDNKAMEAGQRFGKLGQVSKILNWLDLQKNP